MTPQQLKVLNDIALLADATVTQNTKGDYLITNETLYFMYTPEIVNTIIKDNLIVHEAVAIKKQFVKGKYNAAS